MPLPTPAPHFPFLCLPPWKCRLCIGVTAPHPLTPLRGCIFPVRPAGGSREPRRPVVLWSLVTSCSHTGKCPNSSPEPPLPPPFLPCTFNAWHFILFFSSSSVEGLFLFPDGSPPRYYNNQFMSKPRPQGPCLHGGQHEPPQTWRHSMTPSRMKRRPSHGHEPTRPPGISPFGTHGQRMPPADVPGPPAPVHPFRA